MHLSFFYLTFFFISRGTNNNKKWLNNNSNNTNSPARQQQADTIVQDQVTMKVMHDRMLFLLGNLTVNAKNLKN